MASTAIRNQRIRAQTLSEKAYEQLMQLIVSGELTPGTPLREGDLVARFGISRTPIREALRRLAEHELVETRANHGAIVRRVGRDEIVHIHQVREALEGLAVELASSRLDLADYQHLEELAEAARDVERPGYLTRFHEFDLGLHALIGERSGNALLAREIVKHFNTMSLIHDQLEFAVSINEAHTMVDRKAIRHDCWCQHLDIIAALKARDVVRSRQAMVDHIRASCEIKIRLILEMEAHGPE